MDGSQVEFQSLTPPSKRVGRFAPSPTGRMHAGNIFSALISWLVAKSSEGEIVLRIEDLDRERSKSEYANQIMCDFELLGLTWDKGPFYQARRYDIYQEAFTELSRKANVYPCFCTRADLRSASAPHGLQGLIYPGTCKNLSSDEKRVREKNKQPAWRIEAPDCHYSLIDLIQGFYSLNLQKDFGDSIIKRSDNSFAYQLAVVVDDAEQRINTVVRGVDLLSSTPQQLFLIEQLGFIVPDYAHVPLLMGSDNARLSKRHRSAALDALLAHYKTPEAIIGHIAYITGLQEEDLPTSPEYLLKTFTLTELPQKLKSLGQIIFEGNR